MRHRRILARARNRPDYILIGCTAALVIYGLAMLSSASFAIAQSRFGDTGHYLKGQILYGLSIGIVGFLFASFFHYRLYQKFAIVFLFVSVGLPLLLYTPLGVELKGATRQIEIGPVSFQPSELVKLTFLIYLAAWLARTAERQQSFSRGFLPFLVSSGVVSGLLLFQRSTSVVIILMATALITYFVSGARLRYIGISIFLGLALILVISYQTPYRWERITNFLRPEANLEKGGYHLNQSLIAIGSGGITGVGYGESTSKIRYLPEVIGDSIFAVIAEELGFVGVSILLGLLFILVVRMFILAQKTRNKFGQLLLVSFGTLIAVQTFINVGAISGLLPLTGTPLPFISFGRTALAMFMTMMGITVNISKYT